MKNLSCLKFKSMIFTVKSEDQISTFTHIMLDECRVVETDETIVVAGNNGYIAFRKDCMMANGQYYMLDSIDHTLTDTTVHEINNHCVVKIKISDDNMNYRTIYQQNFSFYDV